MSRSKKRKCTPLIKASNPGEVHKKKGHTKKRKRTVSSTEADNAGEKKARTTSSEVYNGGDGDGDVLARKVSSTEAGEKKACTTSSEVNNGCDGDVLASSSVGKSTYVCHAQIRAAFYPKFENEKSDQEVRSRMIEVVSNGLATMEVSLKHSGSLFMYAGHKGGAYSKNSFGNKYTAVGVFVLGRTFLEAWGAKATQKQAMFNKFLEENRMCISMELVTAVLDDHGQRPKQDYVVVTAVTELGHGKPKFYSSPEIIEFCRKWRLPTNHVWLFSTRKSVMSFFAAFDALCEEGTATSVCQTLDQIAEVSVPGSKDHIKVQGEILEGLVVRIVSRESSKEIEQVLQNYPLPPEEATGIDRRPSLREIHGSEDKQIKELLRRAGTSFCPNDLEWFSSRRADSKSVISKFLKAHPADFSTKKLQEMIRLMQRKGFKADFKCFHNTNFVANDLHFKMITHIRSDTTFRRYQREMKSKPELWPLYRGFSVDLNFSKIEDKAAGISESGQDVNFFDSDNVMLVKDGLADGDANLMVKLKFLPYKIRTFLFRQGLPVLFKEGNEAYKKHYLRQMKTWHTSPATQRKMSKMLDEWAVYICKKYGRNNMPCCTTYLNEAEPFLEKYAERSPENLALVGCAGNLVSTKDLSAIVDEGKEEGDLLEAVSTSKKGKESAKKDQGLILFFPGIPGCGKSALCKEILNDPGFLGVKRPVLSLMGDLVKGKYWKRIADECERKPGLIMLADKNAPNEEIWKQIAEICEGTNASAVPIVSDSEGTQTNPFSLEALAVFIFRVLQRANHPGKLDKSCRVAGYVLLLFYHLHEGKSRDEFEAELNESFGSVVKMPLLKAERPPLPDSVKSVLEDGITLYELHSQKHGMKDSTKGTYTKQWEEWEEKLRKTFSENAKYLDEIQVPFEDTIQQVLEQLKTVARGEFVAPIRKRKRLGNLVYAAVTLPVEDIHQLLQNLAQKDRKVQGFLQGKNVKTVAHVTLAHKQVHGVAAVASYGSLDNAKVPIYLNALVFNEKMAALDADVGSVNGEKVTPKIEWPHVTLWTKKGVQPKEAKQLQQLCLEGKAKRIEIDPPVEVTGVLQFF